MSPMFSARRFFECFHSFTTANDSYLSSRRLFSSCRYSPIARRKKKLHCLYLHDATIKRYFALPAAINKRASSMHDRYQQILDSFSSDNNNFSNNNANSVGKELSSLARVSKLYKKILSLEQERASLQELLCEVKEDDEEMKAECTIELERLSKEIQKVENSIISSVIPKDEDDFHKDAILEIRSGAGGDEASLFSSELLAAYERIAKQRNWSCEMLHIQTTDLGGVREASLSITASSTSSHWNSDDNIHEEDDDESASFGPYGFFKWESGVHRVQRVPINDAKIHTSTASVAVLPTAAESSSSTIPPAELKIETMRASGAGGQHVNTTESAVRITHIPTGITATIQDERSQHRNRAKAMRLIEARVADILKTETMSKRGEARRSLMGGGMRSERIRTYNFPQDRITDHRVGVTVHGVEGLLFGANNNEDSSLVTAFSSHLQDAWRKETLTELLLEDEENHEKKKK